MLKISVVIPTYKRQQLLTTCLAHLNRQTLKKELYDVIVVSDGYDEVTSKTVEQFKQQANNMNLKYLSTPYKKGPAAARNLGWQNSDADIIAFTDDDCQPDSHWLEVFYNAYKKELSDSGNDSVAIAYSGFTQVPIEDEPTDFALNTHGLQYADFITANCACSRDAMQITGGFDERYGTAWREDSDLEFNFHKNNIPVTKINEAIVIHPVREAPWGVSIKEQKKGLYDALLFKKYPDLYRQKLSPRIILDFYFIVLVDLICLIALIKGWFYIAAVTFLVVLIMISWFFYLRIRSTKKTSEHIKEMLFTSMVIPFLSVYWRIYGAIKFRVLFLV